MRLKGLNPRVSHVYGLGWQFCFELAEDSQETAKKLANDFREGYFSIEVNRWREKRSLDANAYFHVLRDKLAEAMKTSADDMKIQLVERYGTIDRAKDGKYAAVKLPDTVDIKDYYPYTRMFGESDQGGVHFIHYFFLKQTHDLDSAEMARLIDGTVSECKELGIETMTPQELDRIKNDWRSKNV